MAEEKKKGGPVQIRSMSSNLLSDKYRDSIMISYQFIGDSEADVSFDFFGRSFKTPILAGPIGGQHHHESGIIGYARAINEAGSVYFSDYHNPDIWKQFLEEGLAAARVLKPLADNEQLLEDIRYDTEHGAVAYAMDISHGMTVYGIDDGQKGKAFKSKTKEELKMLNDASPLPFFLKDVQCVRDALIAKEIGIAGLILSGHNNRFPCAVPPLMILPEIRKAVGDEMKIFVDGGILTGYDAFKALALGADGVLCARGLLGAYMQGGPEGLTAKINEMTAELKGAMAATGSADLKHINKDSIVIL
ncbi:MAG: alpha-hydroxy-acid oxidizing protein [Solobacterium sp.]|nr:alpha-hydroxy-acid oxidizing protein [Blautia sp.]MBQ9153268.1 alpha-hydroxy-acid oxidizing protein [Solobacterium sp.]